jgi:hypothetical protein
MTTAPKPTPMPTRPDTDECDWCEVNPWETSVDNDEGTVDRICSPCFQTLMDDEGWDPYPDPYNL